MPNTLPNANPLSYLGVRPETPPQMIQQVRAPIATDVNYDVGTFWVDTVTNILYILSNVTAGVATWTVCSAAAGFIATLTGDAGGAIAPVGANITLAGTGNEIVTTGGVGTITWSISPTLVVPGTFTANAGAVNIAGAGAAAGQTVNIGTSAFQNIVTIGSITAASSLNLLTSTGNFSLDGVGASTYTFGPSTTNGTMNFGGTGANTGTITIAGGTGAQITNIANNTGGKTVNIATGADVNTVTIGSATGASATTIQSGTGDLILTSTDAATIDAVGVLELNSSGAAIGIGNDADAFAINVGTGGAARTITMGNVTGATAVNINTGTGGSTYTTTNGVFALNTGTGAINIGTDAFAKTLTIGNVTGATAVNVNSGTGACAWTTTNGSFGLVTGTGAINLGADAFAKVVTLGNQTGASQLVLDSGTAGTVATSTGGVTINSANTSSWINTAAGLDLNLSGVGCAVNINSTEAQNDAIHINASAANGGVQIHAGTGGILIGDEADTTGITIGNIAPTASRNIVIGSGQIVTAAVTDSIRIAGDGAGVNANSIKSLELNNGAVDVGQVLTQVACGACTSGTHTTSIATGNRAAGAMTCNIMTGTGTKALNIGNADGLTTTTVNGPVNITGDVGVTGDISLAVAGDKLNIAVGANASCGVATLVGGTILVNTTAVTANSRIFLTRSGVGATGANALGMLTVGAIVAATSFVINSWTTADATTLCATDVSDVSWLIIN